MNRRLKGGFYYSNEFFLSPAYQVLTLSARNLLQCLLTELRYTRKKGLRKYTNNGEVSFTEVQFKKLFSCCSSTYLNARNQLIEVGIIKLTYRGGMGRGDMSRYRILLTDDVLRQNQRWRFYPVKEWSNEIPKPKKQLVGVKTQWKKGKSGRKIKATLSE